MQSKINVTENDLFRFVFYSDKLSSEKREYLMNSNNYLIEIKFLNELKSSIQNEIAFPVKRKLAEKIPAYKIAQIVELHPQESKTSNRKSDVLILAAATPDIESKVTVKTFLDEDKSILIKLLNFGDHSKVYIFSTNDEVLTNFKVKFLPQNIEFELKDNTEPLQTNITTIPELIKIDFN